MLKLKPVSKAHLAVLLTNLFFAINLSMVKYISPSMVGAYGVNLFRTGISLFLFWLLWSFSNRPAFIERKDIGRFILCALTGVAINQMLFVKGLTMTSTIHAALLMLCTPLLISLFAFLWIKEKFTRGNAGGILLGIGGSLILILSRDQTGVTSVQGDVLILINAVSYAIYFILVKPLMLKYPPLHVIRWVFTFGLLMILPFSWNEVLAIDWSIVKNTQLLALAVLVFFGTFLTYSFNTYGLKHLGAATTGSYIYTQPVFAAIIAALFLQEQLNWEKGLAAVLIFSGVFLVSRKPVS